MLLTLPVAKDHSRCCPTPPPPDPGGAAAGLPSTDGPEGSARSTLRAVGGRAERRAVPSGGRRATARRHFDYHLHAA